MRAGVFPENSAAIARLMTAVVAQRNVTIGLDLAGPSAAATLIDDAWAERGFDFLERQTSGIGGGTTEMARNNISERVLGMPREVTLDKNVPFRDVPKGPPSS
jgi:alkylation response protein AidB-like acyl-CoA dehydrogenase